MHVYKVAMSTSVFMAQRNVASNFAMVRAICIPSRKDLWPLDQIVNEDHCILVASVGCEEVKRKCPHQPDLMGQTQEWESMVVGSTYPLVSWHISNKPDTTV